MLVNVLKMVKMGYLSRWKQYIKKIQMVKTIVDYMLLVNTILKILQLIMECDIIIMKIFILNNLTQ